MDTRSHPLDEEDARWENTMQRIAHHEYWEEWDEALALVAEAEADTSHQGRYHVVRYRRHSLEFAKADRDAPSEIQ